MKLVLLHTMDLKCIVLTVGFILSTYGSILSMKCFIVWASTPYYEGFCFADASPSTT